MLGLGVGLDDAGQGPVARLIRDGALWAGDFRTQLYYADNEPVQIAGLFDLTNYRNSAAWRINTAGSLIAYAAGEPRVADGSLLVEGAGTNLFLNSDSPATQTITISATGDYTLAVYGSGSVAIAANTATGTGFGTATNGSPVTVDITGTGTVDCTVTGSPTIVQLEAGTVATSPIVTAATTVTRSAEVPLAKQGSGPIPYPGYVDGGAKTILCEVAIGSTADSFPGWLALDDGSGDNRVELFTSASDGLSRFIVRTGGVTQVNSVAFASSDQIGAGTKRYALRVASTGYRAKMTGEAAVSGGAITLPTGLTRLRMIGTNSEQINRTYGGVQIIEGAMPDAEMDAWVAGV